MFKKWNIQFKRVDIIFSALCSVQPSKTIVIILNSKLCQCGVYHFTNMRKAATENWSSVWIVSRYRVFPVSQFPNQRWLALKRSVAAIVDDGAISHAWALSVRLWCMAFEQVARAICYLGAPGPDLRSI